MIKTFKTSIMLLISACSSVILSCNDNDDEYFDQNDSFVTGVENGHPYVDLGLSVKWATCNIGANKPEEYGEYFAWGETEPKEVYNWISYFDSVNGSDSNFKNYKNIGGKTVLNSEDDVAHVVWGGNWRIPTMEERNELSRNCTWLWGTLNGVKGYQVTSKINGNSFFLPAAGCRDMENSYHVNSCGYYWFSTLYKPDGSWDSYAAYLLYFNSKDVDWGYSRRCVGRTVRAVCK